MPTNRGIGELPIDTSRALRTVLQDMQQNIIKIRGQQQAPLPVTGLKATGQALTNLVQWVPSNADIYIVYWSTSPNSNPSADGNPVNVGNSAQYADPIGSPNITRYYWVVAVNIATGQRSAITGPVKATTLASTAAPVPPVPPIKSDVIVVDLTTGALIGRGRITSYY